MLNGQEWRELDTQLGVNGDDIGVGLAIVAGVGAVAGVAFVTLCVTSGCIPFVCDEPVGGECS